jgi:hypothetical protein
MNAHSVNLSEFARRHLLQGRGEWWIVSEMADRWQVDEPEARAIVASVSPGLYRKFLWRRRLFLIAGLMILAASPIPVVALGMALNPWLLTGMILVVGAALAAYGWPGWRRARAGDAPTSLPGRMRPYSPPLLSNDPFEWK